MTTAQKLQNLRKLYRLADPQMRKVIVCRAKLLKMGVDLDNLDEPATMEEAKAIFSDNPQISLDSQS